MKLSILVALLFSICTLSGADIFLAGDSTVCDYKPESAPMTGWGQALKDLCLPGVIVHNLAVGGRSTKSFQEEGRWKKLLDALKPGDTVFIQFGHNDQKKDIPHLSAPADTDYRANLEKFIREVRERHAYPVLCTPVNRRTFNKQGEFYLSLGDYPEVVREVGKSTGVPVIDLNAFTEELFRKEGDQGSRKYLTIVKPGEYPGHPKGLFDNTHYSYLGAKTIAAEIVRSAVEQKLPVAQLFKKQGN